MEFRLLGDVEVRVGGEVVDIGHARQRCVLAVLLVEVNRLVPVDVLVDRVWGEHVPQRARNAVAGYVSRLRQVLPDEVRIVGRQGGYVVCADPMSVDLHRFHALVERARVEPGETVLGEALGLWRGEPFSTVDTPWLAEVRTALESRRFAALLDRNDLLLERGRHAELLAELEVTAAAFPLDERLAGQLVLALYRSGRQADALLRYEQVRVRLAQELGADPGPALRSLHQRILRADVAVPRQLPVPPRSFVGRERELAALDAALAAGHRIVAVTGPAGVGKTALALHWAHRAADRFPDGQVYVDLRRTAEPVVAGRRSVVLLDNARDADQVRSLLRAAPGCLVVVTSRDRLTGLVAVDGAQPVPVDLMSAEDSRALLADRLGTRADPAAVAEVVSRCAGLPLALTVVAARVACTGFGLEEIAAELRDGLDAFDGGDPATDLRTVFSWSYRALGPEAARLFRLLGLHPGQEISVENAAALLGTRHVRPVLAELTRANLLAERRPGRYFLHGLLHAYAAELSRSAPRPPGTAPARRSPRRRATRGAPGPGRASAARSRRPCR
ncbi:hypothetical protein GCM10017774_87200 [Lentzea cavernae]|uniref:DNA-binding transcriptional activator of the SARP family n=1 Tax=Lentzea cavernae TaxID=2020703 RepID=A0ABQ3MTS3_9PSEU|nr:hypothetical protein GCM10017774_87200 [Lentzea cavernae]